MYGKSSSLNEFNEKIANDQKMNEMPFNNVYSIAIIFLINGFDKLYTKTIAEQPKNQPLNSSKYPMSIGKGVMGQHVNTRLHTNNEVNNYNKNLAEQSMLSQNAQLANTGAQMSFQPIVPGNQTQNTGAPSSCMMTINAPKNNIESFSPLDGSNQYALF